MNFQPVNQPFGQKSFCSVLIAFALGDWTAPGNDAQSAIINRDQISVPIAPVRLGSTVTKRSTH